MILAQVISDSEFATPHGLDGWLQCLTYIMLISAAAIHLFRSLQKQPPMDEQLRRLRDEIFETFATKDEVEKALETVSDKMEERDQLANNFRAGLKHDVEMLIEKFSKRTGEIFDEIRSLGRELSHMEGRLSKTQKIVISQGDDK